MKQKSKRLRKDITTTVIDTQTGEVKSEKKNVTYFSPHFDEEKGYLWWHKKSYTKSFCEIAFPEKVSMIDRGRLVTLSKYVWSNTNMLGYRGHGGVKAYGVEQIAELIETTPDQAARFLKRMEKAKVIKPISVPFDDRVEIQYYVNPLYFFSSNRLSLNLYAIFHEELNPHLPDYVKQEFAKGLPELRTS